MDLSEVINIVITTATRTPDQAGFGVPLILSHSVTWTERVRTYTSFAGVAADFGSTTPEYKMAQVLFAQSPHPSVVKIGRANDAVPTAQFEMTPTVINSYKYSFFVGGVEVTYTSDGSATAAEITGGLKTAFDLLSLAYTSSLQTSSTILRLLATSAGNWIGIQSKDPNLPIVQNHAAPSASALTTALDAILAEDKGFYAVLTLFNSKLVVDEVAAWAETNAKQYVAATIDSVVRDTVSSGTDDVGESTKGHGYKFTSVQYTYGTDDWLDAALLGRVLPLPPGTETWAFKDLTGPTPVALTGTQRAHLEAKNVGFYEVTAGLPITWEGKEAGGQYIDITRTVEWIKARLGETLFGILANADKVPYTDKGITLIQGGVTQVLKAAAQIGAITPDFTVLVPKVASVSTADKSTRTLNNVTFSATLTGAVHKVNLQGTISV